MIKKVNQFIYNGTGDFIDSNLREIMANSTSTDYIQLIAPFPLEDSILINYDLRQYRLTRSQDIMRPLKNSIGEPLTGEVVISPQAPYYELVKDYNVWEVMIKDNIISVLNLSNTTNLKVSFAIRETIMASEAVNYRGTFGSVLSTTGGDLPLTGNDGDFYKLDLEEYTSEVSNQSYIFNEVVFRKFNQWNKGSMYQMRLTTNPLEIKITPSLPSGPITPLDQNLTDEILMSLAQLESKVIGLLNPIDVMAGSVNFHTTSGPLNGLRLIDGFQIKDNDRILVSSLNRDLNGIYGAKTGEWELIKHLEHGQVISVETGKEYGGCQIKISGLLSDEIEIVKKSERPHVSEDTPLTKYNGSLWYQVIDDE